MLNGINRQLALFTLKRASTAAAVKALAVALTQNGGFFRIFWRRHGRTFSSKAFRKYIIAAELPLFGIVWLLLISLES